jgi:hypothetical protein
MRAFAALQFLGYNLKGAFVVKLMAFKSYVVMPWSARRDQGSGKKEFSSASEAFASAIEYDFVASQAGPRGIPKLPSQSIAGGSLTGTQSSNAISIKGGSRDLTLAGKQTITLNSGVFDYSFAVRPFADPQFITYDYNQSTGVFSKQGVILDMKNATNDDIIYT